MQFKKAISTLKIIKMLGEFFQYQGLQESLFTIFFYNHGCPGQLAHISINPMGLLMLRQDKPPVALRGLELVTIG